MIKMKFLSGLSSLAKPFIQACCAFLLLTFLSRAVLSACWWENFHGLSDVLSVFVSGVRSDLCHRLARIAVLPCLVPSGRNQAPCAGFRFYADSSFAVLSAAVILEVTTGPFLEEYGVRPNRLYVEYLIYPKEVISMIVSGHIWALVICVPAAAALIFLVWKFLRRILPAGIESPGITARCICFIVFAVLSFGLARELSATGRSIRPISHSAQTRC